MKKVVLLLLFVLAFVCIFSFSSCSGDKNDTLHATSNTECAHIYGDWVTIKEATCKEDGTSVRTCDKCNHTETSSIPKSDLHTEVIDPAVAATCTTDGKTEGKHCSVCSVTIVAQTAIKALGHTEVIDPAVAVTCTTDGKTEGKHCSVCNTIITPQENIPQKDHLYKNAYRCDCGLYLESAKFTIMSQNVCFLNGGPNNTVSDRAPRFKLLVEEYAPDIIGTQEVDSTWYQYFQEYFKDTYGMVGCSNAGKTATSGSRCTILYRLERFNLLESGDFWLSSTPDVVSTISGSQSYSLCSWALLVDKYTGKAFVVANTHLDYRLGTIRNQQIDYVFKGLSDLMEQFPLFLTGDFNSLPDSDVYIDTVFMRLFDPYISAAENRSSIDYTYNAFGQSTGPRIDYCFHNNRSDALWCKIANDQFGGFVSDHYALLTEFILK